MNLNEFSTVTTTDFNFASKTLDYIALLTVMFSDFSVLIMIERFSSASRSDIKAVLVSEGGWQDVKICWEQDNLDENINLQSI